MQLRRAVTATVVIHDLNSGVSSPVSHLCKITEAPVLPVTNMGIQN